MHAFNRSVASQSPSHSAILLRPGPASAPLRRRPSLRSMAPFPAHSWTAATRKPRSPPRYSGASLLRYAGRQYLAKSLQLPPRITRYEASDGPGGSAGRRRGVVFLIIPIGAPFPNIAQHIIQAPGIRATSGRPGGSCSSLLSLKYQACSPLLASVIAPNGIQAGAPRPAGVFPLRLRWKAVAVTAHVGNVSAVDAVERRPLVLSRSSCCRN